MCAFTMKTKEWIHPWEVYGFKQFCYIFTLIEQIELQCFDSAKWTSKIKTKFGYFFI